MAKDRTELFNEWTKLNNLTKEELVGLGVDDQFATDYLAQLQSLYTLQKELLKPAENNHGLPRNLTEEDRKKLDESYQNLINSTDTIRGKYKPSNSNALVDDKLFAIRSALTDDYQLISDIVGNKVSLPFSTAVYNSSQKVITGDFKGADSVGNAISSRIVTTVTDEEGRNRTGFFTPISVVTSPKKVEEATTAQLINKGQLKLKDGVRMDNRNSAMSAVANLLGRSDLIAYSQNMELGTGDKKQKGTFMEFAEGTDLDHCLPTDPYFRANTKSPYAPSAKVDMMDLSIIDYLCLNVDRHTGNMFYKYSAPDKNGNTQMIGLVGIDNDSSFGTKNPSQDRVFNRLASLEETVIISEPMAAKLSALTPTFLKTVLRNQGLDEPAVNAAAERLNTLQTMLENGKAYSKQFHDDIKDIEHSIANKLQQNPEAANRLNSFFNDPIHYAQDEHIFGTTATGQHKIGFVVIPSGVEKYLSVKSLGKDCSINGNTYGIFGGVYMENGKRQRANNLKIATRNLLNAKNKASKNAILQVRTESRQEFSAKVSNKADLFLAEAKKKTGIRGTSPEFEQIRTALNGISNLSKRFAQEGYLPNDMEMNLMAEHHKLLGQYCGKYLRKKEAEVADGKAVHNSYAKDRIELVSRIQQYSTKAHDIYVTMGDAETLKSSVKFVAQADEIKAFAGKMQLLDSKQATVDNIKDIAASFAEFSDKNGANKNMESVIKVYSKKLTDQIQVLGGQNTCGINDDVMKKINDCFAKTHEPAQKSEPVKAVNPMIHS